MKNHNWVVSFIDKKEIVISAGTAIEAKILAQAERINLGETFCVNKVELGEG